MRRWFQEAWVLLKESLAGYLNDNALSHGAAMAFYATTSLAPILLIVVAIAGIVIGNDAAQLALSAEFSGVMGPQSADLLKAAIETASHRGSSTLATVIGLIALLVTASGVFGEMQQSLNQIWKVKPDSVSLSRLVRARAASLGLVAALGFMLLVSLAASTAISALGEYINERLPFGELIVSAVNTIVSFALIALLFAAIYKVLPDRRLKWRDVAVGSVVTALLFTIGKSLIGWYIGTSAIATSYGAAGALMVVLVWVYYSAQIFFFGAEITRAYSVRRGSRQDLAPVMAARKGQEQPEAASGRSTAAGSVPAADVAVSRAAASAGEVGIWIVISSLITLLISQWGRRGN
ncbi:YihY/virulence factor BrkB family protein [Mesorhizobium sp. M1C.F.Ca.ET.193.01.1.1]|uniref:YihY/virulence factor BrkB family protein n=1 Tax=unclassified Mesorhizobium TaxID=325217 RepID=UPI000FD2E535|nr:MULTISPECIES: YihY/virulence factor BrkB family protein [unclassified Mesorhizobium]TGS93913.1 YihY/virulence factor BrkB family protein [bacterium M00.F.Ca.ET.177.01.1.1]TGQ50978.1 YihY/virulence factor BrkB family protein [Mesorhizobium sp. M1C.F.Ca.ET.210.01.1.1]TGQ66415.1 YihY/virulence factor BrkB family protein [Mesorhizobium sp. M1C.F.Ca.ET.212.01.1.1]TGR00501.1 YihY/virulence factor BrkB family protein [Mesorhizobium sp. M1C.F.Ca.ET.204.01.1.1]TGR21092.1 YihY/virulence factor BrkB f